MKKCNRKRAWAYVLSLFMFVQAVLVPIPAYAGIEEESGEYEIYPTPQSMVYGTGTTALTEEVNVTCGDGIDDYTKTRIEDTLAVLDLQQAASAGNGNTKLTVGVYGSGDAADTYGSSHSVDASIYTKYDAYTLWIDNGEIVILGKNTDAAYYGVTSLKRIFEQLEDVNVRNLTLKDYADIEFRGFIEGYYGNPWSHEDRMDLMRFGGEIKMNQYIYAPKDDPLHNSRWRELYDEEGLKNIAALAQAGNESKCFFVFALHPFMHNAVNLSDATYDDEIKVVQAKFEQVIRNAGVRQIAILEDDARGETAEHMIRFLNDMNAWLKELKKEIPDLKTDILYCPTCYMATTDAKMTAISEGVSKEIHIVVTGGKIWGEVSQDFSEAFYNGLNGNGKGRYPYMWVNWPCNDNTKNSLIMGGHNYILHTGVEPASYEGIVLNPIQESEPSKVAIFTASDYCWNLWENAEEGDQAWDDAFKYIDHMTPLETEESNALREIAKHMINQKPSQPQVQFEESVNIKDQLNSFRDKVKMETFTEADITSMRTEFEKIDDAINLYLKQGKERIVSQMEPFMNSLRDTVEADIYLLDALKAILSDDSGKVYDLYAEAQMLYEQSTTYGLWYVDHTEYALGGRKYIQPFTTEVMKYVSDKVKMIVDPEHIQLEKTLAIQVGGNTVNPSADNIKNATDGNLATSYLIQTLQEVGDYVGMTFNIPVEVKDFRIALSQPGNEGDFIYEGKLEYTQDGKTWTEFAADMQPAAGTNEVEVKLDSPMNLRGFRLRCTGFGSKKDRWLAIRDIGYNIEETPSTGEDKYTATVSQSEELGEGGTNNPNSNLIDGNDATFVWYEARHNDSYGDNKDFTFKDDYIQLDLGEAKPVGLVRALVGAGDGDKWTNFHLAHSADGTEWTNLNTYQGVASGTDTYEVDLDGVSARYIRLVNDVQLQKWVKFSEFSAYPVGSGSSGPEGDAMDYTNTEDEEWRVEYGEESSKVFPRANVTLEPNQYIGLKLDRIHAIDKITIEGTGIDGLTAEKSMNAKEWTAKDVNGAARYIRLMNKTNAAVTFSLTSFTVETDEILPMDLLDSNIGDGSPSEDARDTNTTRNWMDGDLTTSAKYTAAPSNGSYVTYDLGQEITIDSVRVWSSVGNTDYPRDAKIQVSMTADDNAAWQDILVIGDGVADSSESFSKAPQDNGWTAGTGAVGVNYAYQENTAVSNVKARYIRLYFTAANAGRWLALNEIEINDGEYFPTINDPTFETDVDLTKNFEPQNLVDLDLTTAFKTADATSGSLIYHLSDETKTDRINILQSGSSISNATVSVRTGADKWETIGTLYRSFSSFYTGYYENVYDVKLEWENVIPVIYEIITLQNPDNVLDRNLQDAQNQVANAQTSLDNANNALTDITGKVNEAEDAMNQAADGSSEKLKAEADYYRLRAEKYGLEADVAGYTALKLIGEAELARAEAQNLRAEAANKTNDAEKNQLIQQAEAKEAGISGKLTEAQTYQDTAADKRTRQAAYEKIAADKKAEYEANATVYYNVTFESNGGSEVDSQSIKANEKVEKPANPTKTGYIFDKWYSDEDLTIPYNFRTAVTADMTLYAGWTEETEPKEYTVTFNSKGGSNVSPVKVEEGGKVEKPEAPTKDGYTFDGWYTDEECTNKYDFNMAVTADMTLYAGWTENAEPIEYTVTFDSKGGSKVDSVKVEEGGKVEEPETPTREHYIFEGWFKDESMQTEFDFAKDIVDSDITLYAKWKPDSSGDVTFYKVTFNSNGGTSIAELDVIDGEKAAEPEAPTRDGYTFDAWYTNESLTDKYDFSKAVTGNLTLYAKWIPEGGSEGITYTVTFNSNGGSTVSPQTVKQGEKAKELKPIRSGYTFGGWYTNATLTMKYDFNTAVTGNLTLYAKWTKIPAPKPVTYKVTFISNGGTTVAPKTVNQNSTVSLVSPTRKDYKFDGWYTDKACTKKFAPGTKITRDLTLYAKWIPLVVLPKVGEKKISGDLIYKITVSHATEGTVSVSGMSKTSKKKIIIPSTVTIDNIVYKVTSIDSKAFTKGKKMTTVEIGANITKIDAKAFYNCKKLKTIKFKTAKTPKFGSKAFKGTNSKCKVYVTKAMSKKEFNNFKKKCKRAGMSKKASYKRK